MTQIEKEIPLIEEILAPWQQKIGSDYLGYKNHIYRVIHFCFALSPFITPEQRQKIIIASCFHDLGRWVDQNVDYIPPSIHLACDYLQNNRLECWIVEVALMIEMHHKLRAYTDPHFPLVERFRQGDLIDFSLGLCTFGVPKRFIREVKATFPNAGFHQYVLRRAGNWFAHHPFRLPPFLKW